MSPTVLIVDDEAGVRDLLSRWIAASGYSVRWAADTDEAEAILRTSRIDAAICDVLMPGEHNGVWLIEHLRAEYPHIAIVIATGVDDMPPTVTLQSGIAGYVVKPFAREDLMAVLRNALSPDSPWARHLRGAKRERVDLKDL